MAVPVTSTQFSQLLDSRFSKLYNDRYAQLPDMLDNFFSMLDGNTMPTKDTARFGQVGAFGDIPGFTGSVSYDDVSQGYTSTLTHVEYAAGFQIERKLFDDDLYGVMDAKPKGLATAYQRTRQKHGASLFNNAFSVDNTWNAWSEGVSLCNDAHTTTSTGVSTATGFDNNITSSLSAVSLAAARIQMRTFRGDRAERIDVMPDTLVIPPDLYQTAFEIVESQGVPDSANNNRNVHNGKYKVIEWNYLTDTNNWFIADSTMMKDAVKWVDRTPSEFGMVEDFDSLIGKWRLYARYSLGFNDWRWILGSQVS